MVCAVTQNTLAGMSPVSPGLKINESKVDLAVDGKWLTIERQNVTGSKAPVSDVGCRRTLKATGNRSQDCGSRLVNVHLCDGFRAFPLDKAVRTTFVRLLRSSSIDSAIA